MRWPSASPFWWRCGCTSASACPTSSSAPGSASSPGRPSSPQAAARAVHGTRSAPAWPGVLLTALTMAGVQQAGGDLTALLLLVPVLAFVLVAMAQMPLLAYTPAAFL